MNKLIMMVGLPASGKSRQAKLIKEALNGETVIHASDELRKELFGDTNDNTQNDKLFQELHKRIKEDLKSGKNVVYDATNINYKRRMAFLQEIKNIPCEKIAVVMATTYEDCLTQNQTRERQVPEHVIKRMYKNFYIPQYYEGWDDIKINWCKNYNLNHFDRLEYLSGINQNNSHHTLTIGEHCDRCAENILYETDNVNLYYAGLLHDFGKAFTKEYKNSKGEPTDEAHYYQHHLVSAYESMFYLQNKYDIEILSIAKLITWHMQPFFMKEQKNIDKFIKMVGQDFYDNLMILHEADKLAK